MESVLAQNYKEPNDAFDATDEVPYATNDTTDAPVAPTTPDASNTKNAALFPPGLASAGKKHGTSVESSSPLREQFQRLGF